MKIRLPAVYATDTSVNGNPIQQLLLPQQVGQGTVSPHDEGRAKGYLLSLGTGREQVFLVANNAKPPEGFSRVLKLRGAQVHSKTRELDLQLAQWLRHPLLGPSVGNALTARDAARDSWNSHFHYKREDGGEHGLRPPQLGALFAVQSHLTVHRTKATVVMPTGTGKTETMLSVMVAERIPRLLVVVPTDPLRSQIADKFRTLGVLKAFGVVDEAAHYPVVGVLKHGFKNEVDLHAFATSCNVVVTTMSLVGGWPHDRQQEFVQHFSHIFVDEAHHSAAASWQSFLDIASGALVVQFTATPFRNDGKPVGGVPIFNYPLSQAQRDGYFKPINFRAVVEFDPRKHDEAIVRAAIEQLKADPKRHILMARVNSVRRAEEVFALYKKFDEFDPVQVHTGITSVVEREKIRRKILNRESRIVVCVDMLGEGFDLPELKIAAFHDIRHSLPITLQLAGRFTRSRADLGDASIVANIANVDVQEELRELYQRDVDWNQLLPRKSDKAIAGEFDLWQFLNGFKNFPKELSLQNVRPAMSAVAFRTRCKEWTPDNFRDGIPGVDRLDRVYHDLNAQEDMMVILTAKQVSLGWAQIDDIYSWDWQLYIVFWDRSQNVLFIHNSSNNGFFKDLAKAICGPDIEPINGPTVFRCLAAVHRLRLNNVGLLEQVGRLISYTMRAGSDVESGMTEAQKQRAIKANLFGTGFEAGHRTTIGCSYKGRIWSRQTTNLLELKRWCQVVGANLIDGSLDPEAVLNGTLVPESVCERPDVMPLAVEWPDEFYREVQTACEFQFGTQNAFLHEVELALQDPDESTELKISLSSEHGRCVLALELFEGSGGKDFRFVARSGDARIRRGTLDEDVAIFFTENPPTIWFADGSSLSGNQLIRLKEQPEPFPRDDIVAWAWKGTNLRKESQGISKAADSIQFRVLKELRKRSVSVLFDDDDQGEVADIVLIQESDSEIEIELYHCKYTTAVAPGSRIDDMYVVCGQAQRSVRWMESPSLIINHMLKREPRKRKSKTQSRFEVGDKDELLRIRQRIRTTKVSLRVFIVQPGLSKQAASRAQLELLSVTESYLKETFAVSFGVIASP